MSKCQGFECQYEANGIRCLIELANGSHVSITGGANGESLGGRAFSDLLVDAELCLSLVTSCDLVLNGGIGLLLVVSLLLLDLVGARKAEQIQTEHGVDQHKHATEHSDTTHAIALDLVSGISPSAAEKAGLLGLASGLLEGILHSDGGGSLVTLLASTGGLVVSRESATALVAEREHFVVQIVDRELLHGTHGAGTLASHGGEVGADGAASEVAHGHHLGSLILT